jgi:hypothetical protein
MPCASNAPARKNLAETAISNRGCRSEVVWGMTVTRERSDSSRGTLRTTHGRTFAASPRSTIYTPPRSGALTPWPLDDQGLGTLDRRLGRVLRPKGRNTATRRRDEEAPPRPRVVRPRIMPQRTAIDVAPRLPWPKYSTPVPSRYNVPRSPARQDSDALDRVGVDRVVIPQRRRNRRGWKAGE